MRHILLVFGMACVLSACGDPLRNVARLSDVNAVDSAASVAQTPTEANNTGGGLFGRLLNRQPDDPTNAAVEAAIAQTEATGPEAASIETPVAVAAAETAPRRGLFGLFGGNRTAASTTDPIDTRSPEEVAAAADVTQASAVAAEPTPAPAPQTTPDRAPRTGLAGLFRRNPERAPRPRTGPDALDVEAGTVMPFGQIARVCGLRANELGTPVDTAADFRIFDTIPNSTAPRPFFITGFDDDCARTFTGAVMVTGDVETHEFVRYRPSNERIPYSTTDNAYEALKASVCRVGRGQPCGADRLARLDRNTHFITVYNFFGGTFSAVPTQWAQILVHDGEVLAMSIKNVQ